MDFLGGRSSAEVERSMRDYATDKRWEEWRLAQVLEAGFFNRPHRVVTDRRTQKRGIDVAVGDTTFEFKLVRYPSRIGAITIETHSNLERSGNPDGIGDGWINYSEADWLAWCFTDKAYLWRMPDLRVWFYLQDIDQWPAFDTPNRGYTTRVRKVPLKDVPVPHYLRALPEVADA